jgi:hypothetical protein
MEVLVIIIIIALLAYVGALGATKRSVGVVISALDTASRVSEKELEILEDEHSYSIEGRKAKLARKRAKRAAEIAAREAAQTAEA